MQMPVRDFTELNLIQQLTTDLISSLVKHTINNTTTLQAAITPPAARRVQTASVLNK